jgi:ABC-type amino acid transport substrate-binding protein
MARWFICLFMTFVGFSAEARDAAPDDMAFVYREGSPSQRSRDEYAWALLREALEHTRNIYGPYRLNPSVLKVERPLGYSLMKNEGGINVSVFTPRPEFSGKLIPVRIPIDRGILGWRVLLIHSGDQNRFDAINSLADLKTIRFGGLAEWSDVKIMGAADLKVVTGDSFDGLFKMLDVRRFDALSRSVAEAVRDLEDRRSELSDLAIEQHLVIHYPLPVYFWFRNDADGQQKVRRVAAGLESMIADGTFERMFRARFDAKIRQSNLSSRRIIELPNPLLGPDTPITAAGLWYHP